jgi:ABC-2 type transport system permease protein
LQRFGELTAAGVLLLLLPLMIIFLAFDAFAGERESGTLRQALSIGVTKSHLVFGKVIGIAVVLFVLLVPATVVGVLALALATGNDLLLSSLPRFALMSLSYLLYFSGFLGITLAVSAIAPTSRMALVTLIGFWIFACLIVPRLANDIAERTFPTPSSQEFWAAVDKDLKEGIDGHDPSNNRTKQLEQQILAQYGVAKKEDLPINFNGISLNAGEEYANKVFDKQWGKVWETYYAQESVQEGFGIITPFIPMRGLSMALAGTDLAHNENYEDAVEQYRRDFNRELNMDFANNSKTQDGYNYFVDREVWENSLKFSYVEPPARWALANQTWNLLLLTIWAAGAVVLAIFAAGRMRID